ncbi:MAG: CDP-alcohol phosphatidyltransferase family protein [Myxococcota bacterium]
MKTSPSAWILRGDGPEVEIWGLSPQERLRRSLQRAGCANPQSLEPQTPPPGPDEGSIALFRGDVIFDERLIVALVDGPERVLVSSELGVVAVHVAGAHMADALVALTTKEPDAVLTEYPHVSPETLVPAYIPSLRKSQPPYLYAAQPERAREVEALTFAASYKGLTDLVTKWVWPRPAAAATRWCARHGVHPNTVTGVSWVFAILAMLCFAEGDFGIGLLAAWAMTFLDTVDGKLARVTLTSSRLGDVLDHGLDLLHPPFWYYAWALGVGGVPAAETSLVIGGYVLGRLLEGAFLAAFGIETHSWRPIDALFRTITARRNPNLILLSVGWVFARPDLGFRLVALWTACSLLFHTVRLGQAGLARYRGDEIRPCHEPARKPSG